MALKAEYLELTGEPYRTAEEEALSISEARSERSGMPGSRKHLTPR